MSMPVMCALPGKRTYAAEPQPASSTRGRLAPPSASSTAPCNWSMAAIQAGCFGLDVVVAVNAPPDRCRVAPSRLPAPARPRRTPFGAATTLSGRQSHVEAELHDVAVGHDVVLAFHPDLAGRARCCHGARADEVVVRHDFCLDEAALEVGVDHTCRLGRRGTVRDRPGTRFLRSGREER